MLQGFLGWLGLGTQASNELRQTGRPRLLWYGRFKRLYDGWKVRNDQANDFQYTPIKFNLTQPIINIQVDFFAGKDIAFLIADEGKGEEQRAKLRASGMVTENDNLETNSSEVINLVKNSPLTNEATKAANRAWKCSGGTASFIENALAAAIYGDGCAVLAKDDDGNHCIRWIDATIAYPSFDPHDYEKILRLEISYRYWDTSTSSKEGNHVYNEVWENGSVVVKIDDKVVSTDSYNEELFGGIPCVWLPNLKVKGEQFGRSDVQPIQPLIEEYDHICTKQTQIIDYYASPNIVVKGTRKPDSTEKGMRKMFFLPSDGDMFFVEWKGTAPTVDVHIDRIRENISEVSGTPLIAFGKIDLSSSDVSGLALRMLFGPLLSKTDRKRTTWGPKLQKLIYWSLLADGITVDIHDIDMIWQSPLPNNSKEDWEIAVMKNLLGVSKRQIQREQGYSEEQIDQIEGEFTQETQQANQIDIQKQVALAKALPAPETSSTPSGAPKKQSKKEKADHTGAPTKGRIVDTTGDKGAV